MTYEPTEADVQAAAEAVAWGVGEFHSGPLGRERMLSIRALSAVVPGIIARELRAAALYIGHHEDCRQDPDRDPYIGCECRVSLLYGRADRIEAGAGKSFCADCPDHEACSQGAPCGHVKRIAVARAKAEAVTQAAVEDIAYLRHIWIDTRSGEVIDSIEELLTQRADRIEAGEQS